MMMVMIMMILTKYIKADTSLNGKLRSQFEILSPGNIFLIDSIKKKEGVKMEYRSLERTQTFKSVTIFTHFSASFDNRITGHSKFVKISFVRIIEVSRP